LALILDLKLFISSDKIYKFNFPDVSDKIYGVLSFIWQTGGPETSAEFSLDCCNTEEKSTSLKDLPTVAFVVISFGGMKPVLIG